MEDLHGIPPHSVGEVSNLAGSHAISNDKI